MKLNQIIQQDTIRALIYSPSGSAKTTLAGLVALHPELRPVYFYDWDLRIASLRASIPPEYWEFIESDPYRDIHMGGDAFISMQAHLEKLGGLGFKTVVVDSYTFAMRGMMARVLQLDGGKPSTTTPQVQHYMQQMSLAEETVSRLCAKKLNVIITCHEDTSKDEMTGRLFKAVDLTGKMANRIPGYFNELWHCEVRQVTGKDPEYVVRTRSDMTYAARTSHKSLLSVELQGEIWPKILAERAANSASQPASQPIK